VHTDGNIFSLLAFFIWIPIALWGAHRWPPAKAAALLLFLPVMFLPDRVYFDLPGLPQLAKNEIAIFWLFLGVLMFHRGRFRSVRLNNWVKLAILLLLGGKVLTVFLNSDPVWSASVLVPSHRPYDVVHLLVRSTLRHVLPFVLGVAMFNSAKDLRILFRIFVGAALVYSIFQLIELRLSPQLHRWVYGFYPHSFLQTRRDGGFRPSVFMQHGIAVAMFTMASIVAAAGLYKTRIEVFRTGARWAFAYLWLILMLSKSLAAFLYTLIAVPLILLATPKTQFRVAAVLAVIVLAYPAARSMDLVPVDHIRDWVASEYSEQRVSSVMTRFVNEERLLERASERSFFGWGQWCRACVRDPESGRRVSVSDGDWIITWGQFGRVGFLGKYLLLLLPIFLSARRLKYVHRESDRRLLAALALIIGFSVFDLLPNGNFNYLAFAFSGALMGCSVGIVQHDARQAKLRRERAMIARQAVDRSSVGAASSVA